MNIDCRPGDIVVVTGNDLLARLITDCESREALGDSKYIHAFTVTGSGNNPTIIDTLLTVQVGHLFDHTGTDALIGRYTGMTIGQATAGIQAIACDIGQIYPFYRLPLDALDIGRWFT